MKILLAEDEEQLSRVLVAAMQSVNYEVDPVFNGRDAVELAKKNSYDVIILDIMMPVMDGITALHAVDEHEWRYRRTGTDSTCTTDVKRLG